MCSKMIPSVCFVDTQSTKKNSRIIYQSFFVMNLITDFFTPTIRQVLPGNLEHQI